MYSRVNLKETAKKNIEGKIWSLFLCAIIVALCFLTINIPILGLASIIVVVPALTFGNHYVYLKLTAQEEFSPSDLFFAFKDSKVLGKVIGTFYLTMLYTFLWSLLLLVPGVVKAYSYSMAPYIIIENPEMSVKDAIAESQKMMKGRKLDLFVLQWSFIGWYLLSSITFGIAYIYVMPYCQATITNFYRFLKTCGEEK